eukprot:scaffold22400_cov92-Amphora_coffeaeformis.AAC.1
MSVLPISAIPDRRPWATNGEVGHQPAILRLKHLPRSVGVGCCVGHGRVLLLRYDDCAVGKTERRQCIELRAVIQEFWQKAPLLAKAPNSPCGMANESNAAKGGNDIGVLECGEGKFGRICLSNPARSVYGTTGGEPWMMVRTKRRQFLDNMVPTILTCQTQAEHRPLLYLYTKSSCCRYPRVIQFEMAPYYAGGKRTIFAGLLIVGKKKEDCLDAAIVSNFLQTPSFHIVD